MMSQRLLVAISALALATTACGSSNPTSRKDASTDSAGGAGTAGSTAAVGGTGVSGSMGAGGLAAGGSGVAGSSGTGGSRTGGSSGAGGSGTGARPDASGSDGGRDSADDRPATTDANPTELGLGPLCPDQVPRMLVYPYTPRDCTTADTTLRCTYVVPVTEGGPVCAQTFYCQCVGGPPQCFWRTDDTSGCPDGGMTSADGPRADGSAVDVGSGPLCGGKTCLAGEVCCGPAECGRCINALTGPNCPSTCGAANCGPSGGPCKAGEVCVDVAVFAGPSVGSTSATCVANPCAGQSLDCSCAGSLCSEGPPATSCSSVDSTNGLVRCVGGNKCAAPDTPIATPTGDRPIAELEPGDLVYSEDHGAIIAVPILRVVRVPAVGHRVVHVVTASGSVLDISGAHPTADGRKFSDLELGDRLDGAPIVVREIVPYRHAFTFDILPASSSGTYVASGALIGSTLK